MLEKIHYEPLKPVYTFSDAFKLCIFRAVFWIGRTLCNLFLSRVCTIVGRSAPRASPESDSSGGDLAAELLPDGGELPLELQVGRLEVLVLRAQLPHLRGR